MAALQRSRAGSELMAWARLMSLGSEEPAELTDLEEMALDGLGGGGRVVRNHPGWQ